MPITAARGSKQFPGAQLPRPDMVPFSPCSLKADEWLAQSRYRDSRPPPPQAAGYASSPAVPDHLPARRPRRVRPGRRSDRVHQDRLECQKRAVRLAGVKLRNHLSFQQIIERCGFGGIPGGIVTMFLAIPERPPDLRRLGFCPPAI